MIFYYDEVFEALTELPNDLKKIGMINVSFRKKNIELLNEHVTLNEKIKCLEVGNKSLHEEIASFNKNRMSYLGIKIYL